MTIIEPHKNSPYLKLFLVPFLSVVILGAFLAIFLYSSIVDLRHEVVTGEEQLQELKVQNAEFKDELYTMLDTDHIRNESQKLGLILDRHPQYLETHINSLATNL